jgi:hypothetical protein
MVRVNQRLAFFSSLIFSMQRFFSASRNDAHSSVCLKSWTARICFSCFVRCLNSGQVCKSFGFITGLVPAPASIATACACMMACTLSHQPVAIRERDSHVNPNSTCLNQKERRAVSSGAHNWRRGEDRGRHIVLQRLPALPQPVPLALRKIRHQLHT